MIQAYIVVSASRANGEDVKAGDRVYALQRYDYGLASDDTHYTGVQHVSVTYKDDGDYPSFTIPLEDLEAV